MELKQYLVPIRRALHESPEIAMEERNTSAFVQERLREIGIEDIEVLAGTGVTALLRGEADGPTVMLRADMDALPIEDAKAVAYASKVPGKAHLCGHDAHTAMLLGAAKLLKEQGIPRGNVKLVFQPGEERMLGAKAMIEEGVLEHPRVDAAFGLHVSPDYEVGQTAVSPGRAYAYTDGLTLEIIGKGGHAALPHTTVDSIVVASQAITALQQVVSRMSNPLTPVVVSFGSVSGGSTGNVIAPKVAYQGTIRTRDPETRAAVHQAVEQVVAGVCSAFGATYTLSFKSGGVPIIQDDSLLSLYEDVAASMLGKDALSRNNSSMGGEDFAFYSEKVPALYFELGVRNEEKGIIHSLHHPLFDLDEDAMPIGSKLLAQLAQRYLAEGQQHGNRTGLDANQEALA